ncbi:SdrD B-like domain-containing protein, partial [Arcicella aurantiaca]|uniref:SdrD B-like domain-containing protein n=1 Tax=Arcicella aurantiaca TaxID=591202 RepID=UPI00286DB63D
ISATSTYSVGCKNTGSGCETPANGRINVIGTVNPNLPAPIDAKSDKVAICLNESYVLSASCGIGQTVKWYDAAGTALTTLSYTGTVAGTYDYYVGCTNPTGCETPSASRAKVTVVVNPIPTAPTDAKSSKGAICLGETIVLSATCGANQTAKWYDQNGVAMTSLSFAPSPIGTYTYSVGCQDNSNSTKCETLPANRAKVTVVVNPIPVAPTSGNVSGGAVCGSGSVDMKATCLAGSTPVWYDTQSSTTALKIGSPYTVAVTANKTYYVACRSLTTPTECESPVGSRTPVDVIYNITPVPVATATPNAICVGGKTTLAVTSTFTTYAWEGPNGFTNSNQSVDINNIVTANAGVYTVTVSAAGGCTGVATVKVTVNTNPTITASVLDNTVCEKSTIELRSLATVASGATVSTYSWTGPNTYTSGIQNPDIASATAAMAGNYVVKVTDNNGCTATSQVNVVINPLPTATASVEGGNVICLGAPISFTASGAGIGGQYQWTGPAGSNFSETTQNPTILTSNATNAGVYTVSITNSNGCTATTTINVVIDKCLKLGNLVWEDKNNNGVVDSGETGIDGVNVRLFVDANNDGTPDGAAIATQVTSNGGKYLFQALEPNYYIVEIDAPTGYKSSTGTNGSATGAYEVAPDPDNDKDNDDNGSTFSGQIVRSKTIQLQNFNEPTNDGDTDNNTNLTLDFGLFKPGKLGDYVWNDDNRNGQQDSGETGQAGITVNLYDASSSTTPIATAVTDANGKYLFDNLNPNTYVVEFVKSTLPNDKQFTVQNSGADATDSDASTTDGKTAPIVLGIGESNLTIDAGIQCPLPTPTATTTTTQVCVGGTIILKATGGKAYAWKGPNAFVGTTADINISNAVLAYSGTYTVTVTADNICAATATATVAVTVNANPTVSATGAVVCETETINLKAEGSGTFTWSGPSFSSTQQ